MFHTIYISDSKQELLEHEPAFNKAEREGDIISLMAVVEADISMFEYGHCEECAYRLKLAKRLGMNLWVMQTDTGKHISGLCPIF
jgi:hypothetical protein